MTTIDTNPEKSSVPITNGYGGTPSFFSLYSARRRLNLKPTSFLFNIYHLIFIVANILLVLNIVVTFRLEAIPESKIYNLEEQIKHQELLNKILPTRNFDIIRELEIKIEVLEMEYARLEKIEQILTKIKPILTYLYFIGLLIWSIPQMYLKKK